MSEPHHLDELEARLQALARELEGARAEIRALRATASETGAAAPPAATRPPIPRAALDSPPSASSRVSTRRPPQRVPQSERASIQLEDWIGRHGTVVLGVVTGVMGAGAFLGWAIARGLIGPTARVVIGAIVALAVAALGLRLRRRGAPRFGSILLGLALALMHVDAWGAGPYLHVVPITVALAMAALASAALELFALNVDEEALFSVGAGGALLAPFVTSDGPGSVPLLLSYGMAVIASGHVAVRGRDWQVSRVLLLLGTVLYAMVGVSTLTASAPLGERVLPVVFALAATWSTLLVGRSEVDRFTPFYLLLAALVHMGAGSALDPAISTTLALIGTATALVLSRDTRRSEQARTGAELLPLAFLVAALAATTDALDTRGAMLAALWTAIAAGAAWLATDERRDNHLFVGGIASAIAILLAFYEQEVLCIALLSGHAVAVATIARRLDAPFAALPAVLSLLIGSFWAAFLLVDRPAFAYTPFATLPSLAAGTVVIGWWWLVSNVEFADEKAHQLAHWVPLALLVLWIREEFRMAFSPDLATFMLVVFYAGLGVALISLGRRRADSSLRRVGLAFAILAALKALIEASGLGLVGLRVGSYGLVSVFLFAVAYWYRDSALGARHSAPAIESPSPQPSAERRAPSP